MSTTTMPTTAPSPADTATAREHPDEHRDTAADETRENIRRGDRELFRQTLRAAARAVVMHLRRHPTLTAVSVRMTLRCGDVQDVVDWCSTTSYDYRLTLRPAGGAGAELVLETRIDGGPQLEVITDGTWLAEAWHVPAGEQIQVRPDILTPALEARARHTAARQAPAGNDSAGNDSAGHERAGRESAG